MEAHINRRKKRDKLFNRLAADVLTLGMPAEWVFECYGTELCATHLLLPKQTDWIVLKNPMSSFDFELFISDKLFNFIENFLRLSLVLLLIVNF